MKAPTVVKTMNEFSPIIRFNNFNTNWDQKKWIETVDISTDMVDPKTGEYDELPHIGPGNIESFTGMILENIKSVKEDNLISGKFKFQPGDIIYGKINPQLAKYALPNFEGLTSADTYVLNTKNEVTQEFLYRILQTRDFYKYSVSVSKRTGMPKINRKELNQYSYFAPSLEEQYKIGDFFKQLDEVIDLNQHALDLLKQRKKAFLQKMIPSKGESVPDIRFSGFSDNWETVSISDIFKVTRGKVLAVNKVNKNQSDEFKYPVYSSQTKNQGLLGYYTDYLYDTAITWTTDGANAGTVTFREGKFYSTNVNGVLLSDKGYANKAVAEILNKIAWKYVSKVGNPKLMNNIMSEIKISIPSLEEQLIIGKFFKELDNSIILQEEKLEALKLMKKAFLQKMFV